MKIKKGELVFFHGKNHGLLNIIHSKSPVDTHILVSGHHWQ
jgi:hypothetical protein